MMETNLFRQQTEKLFCKSMALNHRTVLTLLTYITGRPGYPWHLNARIVFNFENKVRYVIAMIFSNFLTSNDNKSVETNQIIYKIQPILTLKYFPYTRKSVQWTIQKYSTVDLHQSLENYFH